MEIFVSFSFRPKNDFVEKLIIPLNRCFYKRRSRVAF